jgi:hypothetical protein
MKTVAGEIQNLNGEQISTLKKKEKLKFLVTKLL